MLKILLALMPVVLLQTAWAKDTTETMCRALKYMAEEEYAAKVEKAEETMKIPQLHWSREIARLVVKRLHDRHLELLEAVRLGKVNPERVGALLNEEVITPVSKELGTKGITDAENKHLVGGIANINLNYENDSILLDVNFHYEGDKGYDNYISVPLVSKNGPLYAVDKFFENHVGYPKQSEQDYAWSSIDKSCAKYRKTHIEFGEIVIEDVGGAKVVAPRDPASGLATGKRSHRGIVVN